MNDTTDELLSQLRDVQTPQVSAWPAPGWWLLLALVVLLGLMFFLWRRQRTKGGWLRQARAELTDIRAHIQQVPPAQSLANLSQLTRRVVLARSARTEVASVHGEAWLAMLDEICGEPVFAQGYGRLLTSGPYRNSPDCSEEELTGLADAVERLIDASKRRPAVAPATSAKQQISL